MRNYVAIRAATGKGHKVQNLVILCGNAISEECWG